MTEWQTAMMYVVPLILFAGLGGTGIQRLLLIEPKARTWIAMLCGSLIARAIYSPVDDMPYATLTAIDLLSAMAVLSRPKLSGNQAIGALFFLMIATHFIAASLGLAGDGIYRTANIVLGWAQWVVLLIWSLTDAASTIVRHFRPTGPVDSVADAERTNRQGGAR